MLRAWDGWWGPSGVQGAGFGVLGESDWGDASSPSRGADYWVNTGSTCPSHVPSVLGRRGLAHLPPKEAG